jgi:histidinol-phosphatase (PHP family)
MKLFNLHTHSHFCDGSGEPEDYVKSAIAAGFHTLGFSSHGPVPFPNNFAIKDEAKLREYCQVIRDLKNKYSGEINIHLGLELDYIEGITQDFSIYRELCGLDYVIGSIHLVRNGDDARLWFIDGSKVESYDNGLKEVFGGDVRKAVTTYYDHLNNMISTQKPDIVGHLDKIKMHNRGRYFKEDEPWYEAMIMETLKNIKKTGSIVEVNTRGIYKKRSEDLYPGTRTLEHMNTMHIPITLSADAHKPEEIDGYYQETINLLRELGYKSLTYLSEEGWKEQGI